MKQNSQKVLEKQKNRRKNPLSVLLGHKNVGSSILENLDKKVIKTWPTAVKRWKIHQNALRRTHVKG